jgi:diguanylate cyclase (GGDEF)-like protein
VPAAQPPADRQAAPELDAGADELMVAAAVRDAMALARDEAAAVRDRAADARDVALSRGDTAAGTASGPRPITGAEIVMRAQEQRELAARHRADAAEHRAQAARDRRLAALDREQAARDRESAAADRETLARRVAFASVDGLTGARTRLAGLAELDRDLARCRRAAEPLVVAYIDVVGLKAVNDSAGHGAGDALLVRVVAVIRAHLRSYDLIIRLGGDEFLCVMANTTKRDARDRFELIAAALAAASDAGAIRAGFAELTSDETATELIARADAELTNLHGAS